MLKNRASSDWKTINQPNLSLKCGLSFFLMQTTPLAQCSTDKPKSLK